MNFFSHALPYLENPYFMAGTAVPDWLSVADRPVRVRGRLIERFLQEHQDSVECSASLDCIAVAEGARQHLIDDDWFHRQRSFTEVSTELGRHFRQALGPDDNFRAGFLGHIVTEMLLDRVLMRARPDLLERYYQRLTQIDPQQVEAGVNQIATQTTERLAPLIPRFIAERFLFDYLEYPNMLFRLNQVMRRVKLPVLPETLTEVLEISYHIVERHSQQLLPVTVRQALQQ